MKNSSLQLYALIGLALLFGGLVPFSAVSANNDAQFITHFPPSGTVCANTGIPISVTMQNTGDTNWNSGSGYALGSQNPRDNNIWGGWIGLSRNVVPGEQFEFVKYIQTPSTPGTYNFQWQMVQDGVEWFGAMTPNIAVQVQNCAPAVPISLSVSHAQLSSTTFNIITTASGSIANLQIYLDGNTVPTSCNSDKTNCWYTTPSLNPESTHTYLAQATSSTGQTVRDPGSGAKTFTVPTSPPPPPPPAPPAGLPPSCQRIDFSPSSPQTKGAQIYVTPYATSTSGISRIELFHNPSSDPGTVTGNTWVLFGTVSGSGQGVLWNTNGFSAKTYRIGMKVVDTMGRTDDFDSHGTCSTSYQITDVSPALTLLSPNGGETLQVNSPATISWSSFNLDHYTLYYSLDSGRNWAQIAHPVYGTSYQWTTPVISPQDQINTVRVRVVGENAQHQTQLQDDSNFDFTLRNQQTTPTVTASHTPQNPDISTQVTISASAFDADGIRTMRIYVDGSEVRTCYSTSYCSTFSNMYPAGTHSYHATAEDNTGNTGSSPAQTFTIQSSTAIPQVFVSHSPSSPTTNDYVSISANASSQSGIQNISIYVDGGIRQTCPSTTTCQTPSQQYGTGSHSYYATAVDYKGSIGTSAVQSFSVGQLPTQTNPQVSVSHSPLSPTATDYVTVTASASDPDGIQSITIYVDGSIKQTCASTTTCQTPSQQYGAGYHSYYATALDYRGMPGTSPTQSFTVSGIPQPPANTIPSVAAFHSPVSPTANDYVIVNANASDPDGIQSIAMYVDGSLRNTCSSITTCQTPSQQYGAGSHSYYATATDYRGSIGTSTVQSFIVSGIPSPTLPTIPAVFVSLSNVAPSSVDFVTITATASDPDGIQSITIYVDGSPRQNCSSTTTCQTSSQQYSVGSHTYYASAIDTRGTEGRAATQSFSVGQFPTQTNPQVSVSHNPLSPTATDYVAITASASDSDGIQSISIYVDGSLRQSCSGITTCQTSSQQYGAGSHSYYAQAQDYRGATGVSSTQTFVVQNAPTQSMMVTLSASPSSGPAPLIGVNLSASVSGTSSGTFTYRFDCTGDGSWEQTISTSSSSYTAAGLCSYINPGIYNARISVQKDNLLIQGNTQISAR